MRHEAKDILEELNLTAFTIKEAVNTPDIVSDASEDDRAAELAERLKNDFGDNVERVKMIIGELTIDEPVHIDHITSKTGIEVQIAAALLLDMELKGYIEQQPGKSFLIKG